MQEENTSNSLIEHYNKKYSNDCYRDVKKIELLHYPAYRTEAAVYWGWQCENLLEIGSGSGDVLLTLSDRYKHCVGVDLSSVRAQELKKLFNGKSCVRIMNDNFETMAFDYPENFFDTVLMIAVLEHMVDPFGAIQKVYKLLKPGGQVIIDTPNMAKWTRRIKLLLGYFPSTSSLDEGFLQYDKITPTELLDDGHLHYFTFRSLTKLLRRFHFKRIECYGYGKTFLSRVFPGLFSECFVIAYK